MMDLNHTTKYTEAGMSSGNENAPNVGHMNPATATQYSS
jgi:hypothetical protein